MSGLSPKREKFAQCIADGMTQADAYRASFNVGPTTKPESIHTRASKIMGLGEVASRVKELKKMLQQQVLWTREDSVRSLAEIIRKEDLDAKTSDRVAALKVMNTLLGLEASQKIDHSSTDGTMTPKPAINVSGLSDSAIAEIMAARNAERG